MLLRWSLQEGFVPLPRSSNPARITANAGLFDLAALDAAQMTGLDALDDGLTTGWNPARQA